MILKTINKGKEEYIEVKFWSFMKCQMLVSLALTGMIWGAFMVMGIAILLFGGGY